jgi:hypothetical protein
MGFYSLMFLVFGFYGLLHFNLPRILTSLGVTILMGALAAAVFVTGRSFQHGRKWAWRASWAIGISVASLGWVALSDALRPPQRPSADNYFGVIYGPLIMLFALFGFILLVLPQTRRYFTESPALEDGGETLL